MGDKPEENICVPLPRLLLLQLLLLHRLSILILHSWLLFSIQDRQWLKLYGQFGG